MVVGTSTGTGRGEHNEGINMKYAKALVAAFVAGGTAFGTYSVDGSVSGQDWLGVLAAAVVAGGTVWAVPNKQAA
jgi:hypothetical protein